MINKKNLTNKMEMVENYRIDSNFRWLGSAIKANEELLKITEKILNHHELTVANELLRTSLLYEIIALLIDSQNQKRGKQKKEMSYDYSPDIYVNSALEYIHRHYDQIRVSDIAAYIGISRYYLTHIFKEKLHVSPQEYLLNYCIKLIEDSKNEIEKDKI